jgi:prophage antirepressor-like protein
MSLSEPVPRKLSSISKTPSTVKNHPQFPQYPGEQRGAVDLSQPLNLWRNEMTTQNTPAIFNFEGNNVRVIRGEDGKPWFVASDIGKTLRLINVNNSIRNLDEDEKGKQKMCTLGGRQEMVVINESGLYTLILRCQGATTSGTVAHRFRKWITAEVIPSIRETGGYIMTKPEESPEGVMARAILVCDSIRKQHLKQGSCRSVMHGSSGFQRVGMKSC